jgi:RpiB/LacA/LacB family sugar-phosphate isomerase
VVAESGEALGIVCCRSAGGVIIAANKVVGARAVAVATPDQAIHAKTNNYANVLGLAGDEINLTQAQDILKTFFETPAPIEERHWRRVQAIASYERRHLPPADQPGQ